MDKSQLLQDEVIFDYAPAASLALKASPLESEVILRSYLSNYSYLFCGVAIFSSVTN